MANVAPQDANAKRMVEDSIETYLRGEQSRKWILRVIQNSGIKKDELKKLFSEADRRNPRDLQLIQLEKECKQMGLL